MTMYKTHHSGARIDRVRGFRTLQEVQKRGQWKAFSSVARSPASKQAGNTGAMCRGIVDRAIANPSAHKRMTGKYMLDVLGGLGFVAKATKHLGFVWLCARQEV